MAIKKISYRKYGSYSYRVTAKPSLSTGTITVFHGERYLQRRYEWISVSLTREDIAKLAKLYPVESPIN